MATSLVFSMCTNGSPFGSSVVARTRTSNSTPSTSRTYMRLRSSVAGVGSKMRTPPSGSSYVSLASSVMPPPGRRCVAPLGDDGQDRLVGEPQLVDGAVHRGLVGPLAQPGGLTQRAAGP